jgi:hypothetical protein
MAKERKKSEWNFRETLGYWGRLSMKTHIRCFEPVAAD